MNFLTPTVKTHLQIIKTAISLKNLDILILYLHNNIHV